MKNTRLFLVMVFVSTLLMSACGGGSTPTTTTPTGSGTDQTSPVIALTGATPITVAQGSTYIDAGSSVTDNVDTGLTATVTGAVNTAIVGTYTLTYNVSDAAGNAATVVTRTVNVTDQTVPVITLTGANPITVAQGSTYIDAGSGVTDNVDTGLTATVTGAVNTAIVGTYALTYNVSDAAGNAATPVTRTVNVTDQTVPVITLTGANPITVAQGSTYIDAGSSVTDNVDVGLTTTVTGAVNTAIVGTYTLTYNVSDAAGNAATLVTRTVNVIVFQPVSIAAASVLEGNTGTSNLVFTVSLAAASTVDISVDYTASDGTATTGNADYTATTATLTILAGATSGTATVVVNGDTVYEANETLTLTLSNPVHVTLATATATGTISNDDVGGINDTGITKWGNASVNNLAVTQSTFPNQDADRGRDAQAVGGTLVKTGGGTAGFDFTQLIRNAAGVLLAVSSTNYAVTPWDCVLDNTTGLMWEVKTTAAGLRKNTNTYTWYNTDPWTNNGNVGTGGGGVCTGSLCDTENYVAAINALTAPNKVCGFTDWRLANIEELRSILDYSIPFPGPAVDAAYFPNTGSYYWSATPYFANTTQAWGVSFSGSQTLVDLKSQVHQVRLVRGGQ